VNADASVEGGRGWKVGWGRRRDEMRGDGEKRGEYLDSTWRHQCRICYETSRSARECERIEEDMVMVKKKKEGEIKSRGFCLLFCVGF
jgi:hypothetical protein